MDETRTFGWQGFTFQTPKSWELSSFAGSYKSGALFLDDLYGTRLALKWAYEKKPPSEKEIRSRVEDFLKKLAKKEGVKWSFRGTLSVGKHKAVAFSWRSKESLAKGFSWYCDKTRRAVILQVVERVSSGKSYAKDIASTFNCHPKGPYRLWTPPNVVLEVRNEFDLVRAKVMTGLSMLHFKRGRFLPKELVVVSRGLARAYFKDSSLRDWLRDIDRLFKLGLRLPKKVSDLDPLSENSFKVRTKRLLFSYVVATKYFEHRDALVVVLAKGLRAEDLRYIVRVKAP